MTAAAIIEEARAKADDWEQIARLIAEAFVVLALENDAAEKHIAMLEAKYEKDSSAGYPRRPPKKCLPRKAAPEPIE